MWLLVILYILITSRNTLPFEISETENEALELTNLFLENLKADPELLDVQENFNQSKLFINTITEKFVDLVSQSQNAEFSRSKRSLDNRESNISRYSINITSEKTIPTEYSDDIRIFKHGYKWYAVSLENKNQIAIFEYGDGSFKRILKKDIDYTTNLAVLSSKELSLILVGDKEYVRVYQFTSRRIEIDLKEIQTIEVEDPQHVVLWEQDDTLYFSVTDNVNNTTGDEDKISKIKIYKWQGRHFDLIQEIVLFNIKKSVPFTIYGSHFLGVVKYKLHQDEVKSYSEIFKFDLDKNDFKPFQRVLTNGCTDMKYFTSELYATKHHFLIVVHSTENELNKTNLQNSLKSIIYKYEDQYFIPFQSIETNAVEWQPIQDSQGHAALLAVTKEGLKGFQYDGWHFFESTIVSNDYISLKYEEITTLHTYNFEERQILVFACDHCKYTRNIFNITFTNFNAIKELHSEFLSWCTDTLKELESTEEPEFVAESLRGDLNEQISLEEDQKRQLSAALAGSNEILINIEDQIDNSFQSSKEHVFENDIEAENIRFNNDVTFQSLKTNFLNNFNIDSLMNNVLDIHDGFKLNNSPKFSVIVSEKAIAPTVINNLPLGVYVPVNDDAMLTNLIVNGIVTFEDGINVENILNNLTINKQNILLKTGNQEFKGDLLIDEIIAHNLTASNRHFDSLKEETLEVNINDISINNLSTKVWNPQNSQPVSRIRNLKVKNLDVGGLVNRVSIPILERRALKKSGNQILEKTYSFDSLSVEKLNIGEKISGKNFPDDFVKINAGEYTVNQDVNFVKGLKVNKLEVLHSLNNITVTNEGELDILLTDSLIVQSIPVKKSFNNLMITNPINLRNKIKNEQMERINPVMIDEESYELDGDVTIEALSEIMQRLKVGDIKVEGGERSLRSVLEKGLKITDTQIPIYLSFTQPLDLDDTIADRVNLLNPHDWLLKTTESPQIVKGQKTFLNDLHLEGPVNTFRLNGVDVHQLQKEILKVEGDQEIGGILEVDRVVADNGIISNHTFFGENSWNIASHDDQNGAAEVSVINGNLKVNLTKAKNLSVKGLINALNISEMVRDIVRKDGKYKIFGKKKFKELYVDELIILKDLELIKLIRDVLNDQVILNKSLDLHHELSVENINFDQNLNNITIENFGNMMDLKSVNNDTTIIPSDRKYDQITVFGKVFISDNSINGKNLSSIENDTVKADENFEFGNVMFGESIFIENLLELEGNIENLDLSNIVEQNSDTIMEIGDKVFNKNVFIDGTLTIEDRLNEFDMKKICEFSEADGDPKILKIEGDVIFVKGPKILNINELSVKDLAENLWFVDRQATIEGTIRLQNTIFNNSVNVKEFIDESNLKLLSQNYFSKSKNQVILAGFSFDDVTFTNISTPKLITKGPINHIVLDDLLKTVLLQNVTQVFESPVYFEEVRVQDLNGATSYSVNNLNLKTDVMRYDNINTVTGHKIVHNLDVETIKINRNIKIQDVDILEWLSNAMLTNGSFSITGKKILKGATFKQGLSLRGNLNEQEFNDQSVMLIDTPQNITGKKNFISNDEDITKFKILRVNGLVNDMRLESFVNNQSNKGQGNILNSEIVFNNGVVVKNLNVDVIYDNVNVTELLENVTRLGDLEHFQEKFDNLLDMSLEIENSVRDQASLFKYFKEIMYFENVYEVFGLKCKDEVFRLLTFSFENNTNIFRTFEWNIYKNEFIHSGENIESTFMPSFVEQISIGGNDYLYIERPENNYSGENYGLTYLGQLLQLINATTFELVTQFERNATKSLIAFILPGLNKPCLGFIDHMMTGFQILCDETGNHIFYLFQTIGIENVHKATTVRTANCLYLFLAKQGTPLNEPSIVVLESSIESPEFKEKQIIFEGEELNGMAAAVIGKIPHVAFSFGPREAAINSGRISLRKLDLPTHQFVHWQHIPLTAPLEVHFVTGTSFEPLLLAPSADASSPLQTFRYDGCAGFRTSLKGAALLPGSKVRVLQNGKFLVTLNDDRSLGVILGAVIKGSIRN